MSLSYVSAFFCCGSTNLMFLKMEKSKGVKKTKQFNYKEQFGVIVICENEKEQIEMFNELSKKKLKLKVVTV